MQHNERLVKDIENARRALILALFVGLVAFILFEALRGQQYWNKVKGEGNLWNYGSSLLYFMAGEMAIVNAWLIRYNDRLDAGRSSAWSWTPWAAAGLAFTFFACDEMLEIHEKLGLAIEESVPLMHRMFPGHVDGLITVAYGLGAILFAIAFLRGWTIGRVAKRYFLAGFVMIAAGSMLDVLPRELYMPYLPFRETEELLEVFAGWGFIAAFVSSAAFLTAGILRNPTAMNAKVEKDVVFK